MSANKHIFMHVILSLNSYVKIIMPLQILGLMDKINNAGTNSNVKYENLA